jgi:WD40 repeat protein
MSGVLLASFYDHALQSQPSISESTSVPPMTPSVAVRSVNSLCFSADGDRLFSVDYAGYLRVWHVRRDLMLISEEKLCAADFDIQVQHFRSFASFFFFFDTLISIS